MRGGADIFPIMSSHFLALVFSVPSWHDGIDSGIDLYLGYTRPTRCLVAHVGPLDPTESLWRRQVLFSTFLLRVFAFRACGAGDAISVPVHDDEQQYESP